MNGHNEDFWNALDELVNTSEIVIDRPKGSAHPNPAKGVEDLMQFTAGTGEFDEASGWIINKSNVGILRPNPDGEGYIVTDFGTGF